ncbi:TetR family transcriptional regulator [Nocardia arthritidis]|uniref:TetR family transcriptional regulator n=1 Tax=Nocardia arthritidis TaxID=228602 RepID=UPI0007A43608|nr:TetR family transcriptional regulator [Nocardia arthritidis]
MSDDTTTRARILEVAMDLFGTHGYHRTSVRAIAEQLGISKAGVLYHYPSKYDILAGLAEPFLAAMERTVAEAGDPDPCEARRRVIEGLLDVFLAHRYLLRLNVRDLALAAPGSIFERFSKVMMQANILVAGPDASFAERVRATQAVAGLSDPVVLYAEAPVDQLRTEVLEGVRLLLAPTDRTPPATVSRGRPVALTPQQVEFARRQHDVEGRGVAEIARELGVSRATLYRYLK